MVEGQIGRCLASDGYSENGQSQSLVKGLGESPQICKQKERGVAKAHSEQEFLPQSEREHAEQSHRHKRQVAVAIHCEQVRIVNRDSRRIVVGQEPTAPIHCEGHH